MNNAALINRQLNEIPHQTSLNEQDQLSLQKKIQEELIAHQAVLVAHYYTNPEIQALAEATGGCIADSLEMARFGKQNSAQTIIVAGVKFMGETAKILSPEKRILLVEPEATCSLDLGCPIEDFSAFCDAHPDREVVVYANTSAAVKARADWVVTSSIAVDLIDYLAAQNKKILWAPDKHLGRYVQEKTGADMILWNGACIVHEEFKAKGILQVKQVYPNAAVLVHPESPESVLALADVVGSTSQLIRAAKELPNPQLIVATDRGIFYKMQQAAPNKLLLEAPTAGEGATCRSCAHCPWMAMNDLVALSTVFSRSDAEVFIEQSVIERAEIPLQRMLAFR